MSGGLNTREHVKRNLKIPGVKEVDILPNLQRTVVNCDTEITLYFTGYLRLTLVIVGALRLYLLSYLTQPHSIKIQIL